MHRRDFFKAVLATPLLMWAAFKAASSTAPPLPAFHGGGTISAADMTALANAIRDLQRKVG